MLVAFIYVALHATQIFYKCLILDISQQKLNRLSILLSTVKLGTINRNRGGAGWLGSDLGEIKKGYPYSIKIYRINLDLRSKTINCFG